MRPASGRYTDNLKRHGWKTVLAYNAPFDEQVLDPPATFHDVVTPASLWECVMRAYAQYNDNKTSRNGSRGAWWKLTEAMEQENLPLLDAHDALADVRMTLNLVRRMAGMDPLTFEDKDEIEDSPIGEKGTPQVDKTGVNESTGGCKKPPSPSTQDDAQERSKSNACSRTLTQRMTLI
jgi:hypothetical protein